MTRKSFMVIHIWCLLACQAFADKALVIGNNNYPNLKNAELAGCVNDAELMAKTLRSRGFEVNLLTGPQATRESILSALAQAKAAGTPDQRFVFYFAGHGTGPTNARILTYNSLEENFQNDIAPEELSRAVADIPAKNRTVILDSCFSGSMSRATTEAGTRSRYYRRRAIGNSKDLVLVNGYDSNEHLSAEARAPICYFTAARHYEESLEVDFSGKSHGVFTYFLNQEIQPGRDRSWSEIQSSVSANVVERINDRQHPTLKAGCESEIALGGPKVPTSGGIVVVDSNSQAPAAGPTKEAKKDTSLWEIFNTDTVDIEKIRLTMSPNKSVLKVGEKVSFNVKVGAPGYLIIVEHGVSGNVHLLYPPAKSVEAARVAPGAQVVIPSPGQAYAADQAGAEHIRAFLFRSPMTTQALLDSLTESRSFASFRSSLKQLQVKSRDFRVVNSADTEIANDVKKDIQEGYAAPFFTSDVRVEIID